MIWIGLTMALIGVAIGVYAHIKGYPFVWWWLYGTLAGFLALPHLFLLPRKGLPRLPRNWTLEDGVEAWLRYDPRIARRRGRAALWRIAQRRATSPNALRRPVLAGAAAGVLGLGLVPMMSGMWEWPWPDAAAPAGEASAEAAGASYAGQNGADANAGGPIEAGSAAVELSVPNVGPVTLEIPPKGGTFLVTKDLVSQVQAALAARGYYSGAIDGLAGPQTRAAVRHYQSDEALPSDGSITPELLRQLKLRDAPAEIASRR